MITEYCRRFMQSSVLCNLSTRNKPAYRQYKRLLGCFKISLHSNSISSWLLLASLFYKYKRFQECLDIITYNLSNYSADTIQLRKIIKKCGLLVVHKHLVFEHIKFWHPFYLLPNELNSLKGIKELHFFPDVYSYLLRCLCFNQLGDHREKINALRDLELRVLVHFFFYKIRIFYKLKKKV